MKKLILAFVSIVILVSCGPTEPKPIKLNSDSCDFCKMTISNYKFAAELITQKGRVYKFDDISCMIRYAKSNTTVQYSGFYINDYLRENKFIEAEKGFYLKGGTINGPMGGKVVIFSTDKEADTYRPKLNAAPTTWKEVYYTY